MRIAARYAVLAGTMFASVAWAQDASSVQGATMGMGLAPPSEAVIYVARDVRTMDPARPQAQAVAVQDGLIADVGSLADLQTRLPKARVDRTLADKVVVAGFVEQHVHPVLAALTMNTNVLSIEDWDAPAGFSPALRDEKSYQAALAKSIAAFNAANPDKSTPFVTWGYHHYFHGKLTRETLNKLSPDRPVIVWHRSCHEVFLNDAALKLTSIDPAFMKTMSATALAQTDYAKGHFYEQGMMTILPKIGGYLASPAQFKAGLAFTTDYYHRNGITLACEPGLAMTSKPLQDMINAAYSPDSTPFNHCFIGFGPEWVARAKGDPAKMLTAARSVERWGKGRTFFLPNQVKLMNDGAIYSQLMMMRDAYTDGHHGAWIMEGPDFKLAFDTFWDAGYQVHIHNNGDAGLDRALNDLAAAQARKPRVDHRTVIVHFGFAQPDQVARAAKLGAIISSNPYYVTALAGRYAKLGIGPERAANMVPMGDVVKNDISFSFHSDMPMAPAKPLQLVWAGVNRTTAEGPVAGPRHRVTVDQAMRAITIDAAYSIQQEGRLGSIAPGKDANLTILEDSPWSVAPEKIKDIKVWGTMLEGRMQPVKPAGAQAAATLPAATLPADAALSAELVTGAMQAAHGEDEPVPGGDRP